jgi:hypothetical protein
VFEALRQHHIETEPVVYSDDTGEQVRGRLLGLDGVLVWAIFLHYWGIGPVKKLPEGVKAAIDSQNNHGK